MPQHCFDKLQRWTQVRAGSAGEQCHVTAIQGTLQNNIDEFTRHPLARDMHVVTSEAYLGCGYGRVQALKFGAQS